MLPSSCQPVKLDTEIRKLQPLHVDKLAWLLNISDGDWKKLMFIIPSDKSGENKFGIDHLNLIEQASRQQKRGCAAIFLEEWSTMGRKRPTLKNLLELLKKAQLFRAADYVSINILNMGRTERPNEGPAAPIEISFSDLESESGKTENSSILGDVHEENSISNEGENLQVPGDEKKIVVPIPAFLSDMTFSNLSEASVNVRSSEMVSQKVNHTGNEEAYKIPVFLENARFSNFSEAPNGIESREINEPRYKVSNDSEIEVKLPRFLCDTSSLLSSTSQDLMASNSADNSPQETLNDVSSQGNCRDVRHEPSSSKENQAASQLPACLNEMSLSNFSGVVEPVQLFESEKSTTRIGFSSQSIKESSTKISNEEIVIKLPHRLCENIAPHQELQKVNNEVENSEQCEEESLSTLNEGVSQLPACLNEMDFSNFSIISESGQPAFTNGLNSDSVDV